MTPASPEIAPSSVPRKPRVIALASLLLIACALPFVVNNYHTFQLTLVLVYAIALLGLNILTGYNGQISLGHGAFFAIGAYVAAILMDKFGLPYWLTLPVAGIVCLAAGFFFGLPALRLEGLYLALATFALGVSMPQLLKYPRLENWTGDVHKASSSSNPTHPLVCRSTRTSGCIFSRLRSRSRCSCSAGTYCAGGSDVRSSPSATSRLLRKPWACTMRCTSRSPLG